MSATDDEGTAGPETQLTMPLPHANLARSRRRCRISPAAIAMLLAPGCGNSPAPVQPATTPTTSAQPSPDQAVDATIRPQVVQFCGGCHGVPSPDTFPRDAWYDEVEQGFGFYYTSGRQDLDPPSMQDVVRYYRSLAPAEWQLPPTVIPSSDSPVPFRKQLIPKPDPHKSSGVAHVRWWVPADQAGVLLVCDMRVGLVSQLDFNGPEFTQVEIAEVPHPAHVEPTDLDADGRPDFLVADLGSFEPADHQRGQVVWLRQSTPGAGWESSVLARDLGRVADVQPADFDRDGDLDLVVAEFGWRTTGHILLLEQTAPTDTGLPAFEPRQIDHRHGTIHVPVTDLDGDGRLDFVALISQEHETVEAFFGNGEGRFEPKAIFAAGDPSYGSSGIELVDMDHDGDLDILYTNGDSLDSLYLKPFHSIQWLENTGTFPFTRHLITRMPGVYRARAADLDGDGDLDVVASAAFGYKSQESRAASGVGNTPMFSLVWLEQKTPSEYVQHPLATIDEAGYIALEVGDFDSNGTIDIAAGQFASPTQSGNGWLTVWWNDGMSRAPGVPAPSAPQ